VTPAAPAAPAASPSPSSDRYEVIVSGSPASALNGRLAGKGLSAESTRAGVVVKPALPLSEAIALSKDFAMEGLKVQVRRQAAPIPAPSSAPAAAASTAGDGFVRVRVGGFADRDVAVATLRELSEKGYPGFIARSNATSKTPEGGESSR
jgi:cell division septation protein DedD